MFFVLTKEEYDALGDAGKTESIRRFEEMRLQFLQEVGDVLEVCVKTKASLKDMAYRLQAVFDAHAKK